ncbi:MAG: GNAT family N-acetyltransferase [Burkholderiales bacterium]|nr:GNAT family N-acetyltransferase [Burkholderiales bacterium]
MTVLVPMRPEEFDGFASAAVSGYAEDNVGVGRWSADGALARARAEFDRLLPQGVHTPEHQLFTIKESADGPTIGHLWFAVQGPADARVGFLYNIRVLPEFRGRGHASAALLLLEKVALAQGLSSIALHVFSFNTGAQALYRSLGYGITGLNMLKPLRRNGAH